MSLSAALTAYAELVGDVITNDCGQPVPSRILRYHGHAIPGDIGGCGDDGVLSVWWGPSITPKVSSGDCQGFPVVTLHARYAVCWKVAEVDEDGITLFDDDWDADAAVLADVADCVSRSLMSLACTAVADETDPASELRALATQGKITFVQCVPGGALSAGAAVEWVVTFGLRAVPTS